MTCNSLSPKRLHLKEPTGWFAAGASFQKALTLLSDGAFKLFAYLCLKADRHTAFFQASRTELTLALGKSSDAISAYIGELDEKGVCFVHATNDSPGATTFQIREGYWPYQMVTTSPERDQSSREPFEQSAYVASVRDSFLALGCSSGKFSPSEESIARDIEKRGIPLTVVQDAMLIGACRKYISWLNGAAAEPIRSLRYFECLIAEVQQQPLAADYRDYLRRKSKQLAKSWSESVKSGEQPRKRGYPTMASSEIAQ